MTLRQKTFSAVRWTASAAIVRAFLQIAKVAVLARLLLPEDYGLMAMVTVVLSFAGIFADFGVNSAFVQRQDVSQEQRSSLFWFNVVISAALSLLVTALSPLLSWIFNDGRLTPLIMLSATTFTISALGSQVRMAAEKDLDFRPVVLLEIASGVIGFAVAVLTAYLGWGVYALVTGSIIASITATIFAWAFIARGWRPMWRLNMDDVRPYLSFGGAMVANNIVNRVNASVDIFLGGRLLGAAQLGLYSVPRNLILQIQFMVNPIVTRVGFPLIAQVQKDLARVRSIYLKTLNMTSSVNAPIYVGIAFFAPEIVMVMLGNGWQESAPLLRILAIWGMFRSVGNPIGSLLLGMGRAGLSLKWNIGLFFLVPPVVWLGSLYGADGMAYSMTALMITLFIPGWLILVRPLCQAGLIEYSIAALRAFVLALLSVLPAYFIANQLDGVILRLGVGIFVSAPLYVVISFKANHEWFNSMISLISTRNRLRIFPVKNK